MPFHLSVSRLRAFSLIEAIIVLAILALVLGGIWAAYKSTKQQYRLQATVEGLLQIVHTANASFGRSDFVGLANGTDLGAVFSAAQAIPKNWQTTNGIYAPISNGRRWVGQTYFYYQDYGHPHFDVLLMGLDKHLCFSMLRMMASRFKSVDTNDAAARGELMLIYIMPAVGGNTSITAFPYTPTGSECAEGDTNDIQFKFGFGRN